MTKKPIKVALFDVKPYDRQYFDESNRHFGFEIKYFTGHLTPDTAMLTKDFDAVCVFVNDVVNEEVIDVLVQNGVKILALRCAGYNNVNLFHAHGKLPVVRVPAYSPYAVAEHAVALLMTLNRKTHRAYGRVRDNNFSINGLMGFDIHGKTVGIVGTGKIGQIFARIMKGFGANLLAYDHYPNLDIVGELDLEYTDLRTLYRKSDIISLHCPLTPETKYMIDKKAIAEMKPGVVLINTSRGMLIDTSALIDGLKKGIVGSAALDVYEEESDYFFEDLSNEVVADDTLARLTTFNNVLITSHQAFFTREAVTNIARTTLQNIDDYLSEGKLNNGICHECDGSRPCPGKHDSTKCPKGIAS